METGLKHPRAHYCWFTYLNMKTKWTELTVKLLECTVSLIRNLKP